MEEEDDEPSMLLSTTNIQHQNGKYIDEYISQTPASLRNVINNLQDPQEFAPGIITLFGCVMLCDVSGFTRLSTLLNLEELRYHMNSLFSDLLGSIEKFGGDSIKLCGDAILCIWTIPNESDILQHTAVRKAVACGQYILENFGVYENNSKSVPVSLRLHCGLSVGILHCMYLGTDERMEWLVSGPQLRDLGLAASDAKAGQLCMSPAALDYLPEKYQKLGKTLNGNYLISSTPLASADSNSLKNDTSLSSPLARITNLFKGSPSTRTKRVYPQDDDGVSFRSSRRKDSVQQLVQINPSSGSDVAVCDIKRSLLRRFIHECARPHILLSDTNFLAEIRHVVTVFIELLNLQDDFDNGEIERPQLALTTVLEVLHKVGGVLRQYVVDDKGIVILCSFGLPNFNYSDNELKATIASLAILSSLEECDISCRIGISAGQAYCGYVGSEIRKEYCVMGPSVNLAARLMSKANSGQILVSGAIFEMVEDYFIFKTLDKILAKGYSDPIQVYSPIRKDGENYYGSHSSTNYKKDYMIGRQSELSLLKGAIFLHSGGKCSSSVHNSVLSPQHSLLTFHTSDVGESNRILILAPEGYGKSMLISSLCKEVKHLRTVIPVKCSGRMEPYQCMFASICSLLNLFNPYTSDDYKSSEIGEFSPPIRDFFEALSAWIQQFNIPLYLSQSDGVDNLTTNIRNESTEYIMASEVLPIIKNLLAGSLDWDDWEVERINIFMHQVIRQMILDSPVCTLIIEDIEWCDPESYNIFMKLMKSFDRGCVIITMSPTETTMTRPSSFTHEVSLSDLKQIFRVMELRKFTMNEIKAAIRRFVGPSLLASNPEVLSEETAQMIFSKSEHGIPSLVVSKLQSLASSLKSKTNSQSPRARATVWEAEGLELDCRIVLKVASVCGAIFSSSLVTSVLEDLDYKDIADDLERLFSILQKKRLIRTTYSGVPYLQSDHFSSDPFVPVSQPRAPAAYCFVEKATLESIYGSLLDSQREAMHASIARGVEADYQKNPAFYSENIFMFLAYHWSRAGISYTKQQVVYYQHAAEKSSDSKLYGDARAYYEQLINLALHCISVETVLKTYGKISSLVKTKTHGDENPLRSRNSFSMNVLCLNRYMSREDFEGPVISDCPFISLIQLSSYFFELSAIEFHRHAYLLSRNLFEFGFFIGGIRLQIANSFSSAKTYFHVYSKPRMRKIIAENFLHHALMSVLRGRADESLSFIKSALKLLDSSNRSLVIQTVSVYVIILLSRGSVTKSQSIWQKTKKSMSKELIDPITMSYMQLYSAIHHICFGEFSLAERELSVTRTFKNDSVELISTCSLLLEAWLSFICGNCRRVENLTIPSSSNADSSPEWLLHDIWCRQLRVMLYGLKGNYLLAKRDLSLLDALQSAQFPKFSQNCLLCFIEVCENQYSSSQRNQLLNRLVSLTEKIDLKLSCNLISIFLSFLTASCCCILLEKTPMDQLELKSVSSFISFTFTIMNHLHHLSSTYRFLVILKEVLQMKLFYFYLFAQNNPSHPLSSCSSLKKITSSMTNFFFEKSPSFHSVSLYPNFTLGSAFWNVQMCKILRYLNIGQSFIEDYYRNAVNDLKQYHVPRDHPFSIES